jgi:signal transduction histidine kinase
MIASLVNSVPFPCRAQTVSPYTLLAASNASLFDQPNYAHANDAFWETIDSEGWRTCNLGYSVYTRRLPRLTHTFLILHGLKITGRWKSKGRTEGLSVVLPEEKIESYVAGLLAEFARTQGQAEELTQQRVRSMLTENVHEIRSMNTSLYHIGYELQEKLQYDEKIKLALAKNVVALSELISDRIELADLTVSNVLTARPSNKGVTVYKKFDKMARCYNAYAKKRQITINIVGDSRTQVREVEHMDMIPLVVIDNAVKYSPDRSDVEVSFQEDDTHVHCAVASFGPKIEPEESDEIFSRERRGVHAVNSGKSGTGIGLFFLKQLLTPIRGAVSVHQDNAQVVVGRQSYYRTTFRISLERS